MRSVVAPEKPQVGKKKQPGQVPPDPNSEPFARIELQAPPEWVEELDRIAKAVGMSRSAYLRNAANIKMAADKRDLGIKPAPGA